MKLLDKYHRTFDKNVTDNYSAPLNLLDTELQRDSMAADPDTGLMCIEPEKKTPLPGIKAAEKVMHRP